MPLVLEVVSSQAPRMGAARRFVVGTKGARIGRTDDNDWVLPSDYVSGLHAAIRCSNGMFFVESCGRTPLVVNGQSRLARGEQDVLRDGDTLEIDRFRISVRIIEDSDVLPPLDALSPAAAEDRREPRPQRHRVRDVLDIVPPANESTAPASRSPPLPVQPADDLMSRAAPVGGRRPDLGERDNKAFTRLPRATSDQRAAREAPDRATVSSERTLAELLRVSGNGDAQIDPAIEAKLGEILHVVIEGTMEVLAARATLKSEFRLRETRIAAEENNPLKLSTDAADAAHNLFVKRNPRYLEAAAAFKQAFREVVLHEFALVVGMKAGYGDLIERFDPRKIEARLERSGAVGGLAVLAGRKGRLWELYCAEYEAAVTQVDRGFGQLFGKAFARAYEEQVEKPTARHVPPVSERDA